MKKLLLLFSLTCLAFIGNTSLNAQQTSVMTNRPLIWGASPFQDSLWSIDTTTWTVVTRLGPTLSSGTITGINGMAQDPITGICYCICKVSAVSGRVLCTINLSTGVCTQVGNLGDNFSSITFDESGQMWGATGDGATTPETLYKIDKTNATKTVQFTMGNGADGEIIQFNRADNMMYHWSGNGTIVFEKWPITNLTYTPTNIPITGTTSGETFGSLYIRPNSFLLSNISSSYNRINPNGTWTSPVGSNPDDLRGLIMMPYYTLTSNDTVCLGTPQGLTVGGHQLYDSLYFNWGDGNIDSMVVANGVLLNANHTYAAAGSYNVAVRSGNGFGGDTIISGTLVVLPMPTVALSGLTAICSGDPTTLTATATSVTYQWYMNGTLLAGETASTTSASSAGVYNAIVTNSFGCADSAAAGLNVVSSSYPVVNLGADISGCGWYILDAGNPGSTYMWSSGGTSQTDTLTTLGLNNVSVTVTNSAGCASMDTINVTINSFPTVNVGPDTTACGSVTVDAGNPGSTYLWCNGATTQMATLTTTGTCMVTVTDGNGCSSNDTINVTINPNPIVNLGPDVSACTMVVITADSSLIGGTFLWCTGGTGLNEIITNSTTCDLQYTDVNGCMGNDTINVTIYGNPTVSATASSMTPCVDDANVTLTGSPAGGTFSGTSVTGNQFDPSIGAGTYSIIYSYTDPNGCSGADTISINVNACVGITENSAAAFQAYPNPTSGMLNITNASIGANIEVFDVLGNVITSKKVTAANTQLDLSNQANGVYFVRVTNGNAQSVQRIILQR